MPLAPPHRFPQRQLGFREIRLSTADGNSQVVTPEGEALTPKGWANQLDINYLPTVVFYSENGREVVRLDSMIMPYKMAGVLQYVREKGYLIEPQLQRWRRLKAIEAASKKTGN
jgi:thioredoxin-related protein